MCASFIPTAGQLSLSFLCNKMKFDQIEILINSSRIQPLSIDLIEIDDNSSTLTIRWNATGFESYPPSLDRIRQFLHFGGVGIGFPLNLLVAGVIFRQRRLRNPRNTFWLGIVLCNILAQINAVIEYVAFEWMNTTACTIFRISAGIPYTLLLTNLLLATVDRWVALTYPLYHRDTVTVKMVVFVQFFFSALVIAVSTSPYWTEAIRLNGLCGVDPTVLQWTTVTYLSLTLLTIAAQVQIYRKARRCLRRSQAHTLFNHSQSPGQRINRLELEATVTLICGVVSLCVFSLPYTAASMADWICRRYSPTKHHHQWCAMAQSSLPYARELLLVHGVYNPIMFIIRSREFSDALRSIIDSLLASKQ